MDDRPTWDPACTPPRGLVRPARLDASGVNGPTRGQARGRAWRQTSHGFYVPASVDGSVPEQRILEASVLLPPEGAVTGWAACRWHGAGYFDGLAADGHTELPVALAVGPQHHPRRQPGVDLLRDRLDPDDVAVVRGVRCTVPERAVFDQMRRSAGLRDAVVAIDMMAAAELTSPERVRRYVRRRTGWNGVPLVRAALDLAVEGSRSPSETKMLLVWRLDARLPPPLVNVPVFDDHGRLLGVADLFDPVAGLVGEYDGALHRGAGRHHRDVLREERFRRAGLEYFKMVSLDLRDVDQTAARMLAARKRALALPRSLWSWTLRAPKGWYVDPLESASLDDRLDHRDWLRAQHPA